MAYNEFAYFYDEFNGEADYDALYSQIHTKLEAHGIHDGIVADLGCGFGGLCSFLRCFHRSLCGFLRRLCRLLCGLDCRFRGFDRPLCGFGCTFPGSLDGFLTGRTGRLFDRLFRLLDRLDGLIPGGADSLPFH